MTTTEWLTNYKRINGSFKKSMVFRLGAGKVGFFSEYNNMLLCMIYCLKNGIKFQLYSDHSPFSMQDGWNDFFLPFDFVNTDSINKDFNVRYNSETIDGGYPLQRWIKPRHVALAYRKLRGIDYLTQDLWERHRDPAFVKEPVTIPDLGWVNLRVYEAARSIIAAYWRYNAQSAAIIKGFVESVPLPEKYISIHVRAGDKSEETQLRGFTEYMAVAEKIATNNQVFVLTDDYTVVESLRSQYRDWQFHTLCEPTERGYFQNDFLQKDKSVKYQHQLRLFAELDIAAASNKFIGTYSSNIGMYMGMRIGTENCFCLDFPEWVLW